MLERAGVGLNSRRVHSALVGKGIAAHVRPVGVLRQVAELVDQMRGFREMPKSLGGHALVAHLELQGGQDGRQVRVSGPLAVAVHRPLDEAGARVHGGERIGHPAFGVVVRVDPDLGTVTERLGDGAGGLGHLRRQARAVGVAQRHVLRPGGDGRPQALERVLGILAPRVEEVLGVVDDALAPPDEIADRIGDHAQVLGARDLGDLVQVQRPGLADQGAYRREAVGQLSQGGVVLGCHAAAAGHAERADVRTLQLDAREQPEQLGILRVGADESGLDEVDTEPVERLHHPHLLRCRQGHPLPLHAVAQGRVVELYKLRR